MKKNKCIVLFISILLNSYFMFGQANRGDALNELVEAERNFAKASVLYGKKQAFINNFHKDAVVYTDSWKTNGLEIQKKSEPKAFVLKWEPEFANVSASGDFGVTTGPWELQDYRPYTGNLSQGYYLSVWRKQNSAWKVILDVGITSPKPKKKLDSILELAFLSGVKSSKLLDSNTNSKNIILNIESRLASEYKSTKNVDVYEKYLSKETLIEFSGILPTTNWQILKSKLDKLEEITWETVGCDVASSEDIAYTYGNLTSKGYYVHIWRKDMNNEWRISVVFINI